MRWSDHPEYLQELKKFLMPVQNTVLWPSCWESHTEIVHFQPLVESLEAFTDLKGKKILDSGCGSAGLLLAFANAGAIDLVGIELDPNIYRLAVLRTSAIGHIHIFQEDAWILQTSEESFDIVVSNQVIEHVSDYSAYLTTLTRLLKPGGILLIACPNRLWPFEAHSNLPFIHYLPRRSARKMASRIECSKFVTKSMRDRARTSLLYETDFSYFYLKKLLLDHDLEVLEMNHPRNLLADLFSHPVGRFLGVMVRSLPYRFQRFASALFARHLRAICRKAIR